MQYAYLDGEIKILYVDGTTFINIWEKITAEHCYLIFQYVFSLKCMIRFIILHVYIQHVEIFMR